MASFSKDVKCYNIDAYNTRVSHKISMISMSVNHHSFSRCNSVHVHSQSIMRMMGKEGSFDFICASILRFYKSTLYVHNYKVAQ